MDSLTAMRLSSDEALLAQCRVEVSRGSGPGGQNRNKTSNAVRLIHLPSNLSASTSEFRSLMENKKRALHRLRLKLACAVREELDLPHFEPPDWFLALRRDKRIQASHRHPLYCAIGGLILDLLAALEGNPAAAAVNLGVSTSAVVKFLESDAHLWAKANEIRSAAGQKPLTHRG